MKPLSETTARTTIGMMRSIASHKPISPFHLMAADEMERLLNEVIEYRKQNENKKASGRALKHVIKEQITQEQLKGSE